MRDDNYMKYLEKQMDALMVDDNGKRIELSPEADAELDRLSLAWARECDKPGENCCYTCEKIYVGFLRDSQ